MADKAAIAKKIAEVNLLEQQMKRLQENTEKRGELLTYSYLISRTSMLRDFLDKATKLHAEIISLVPEPTQKDTPYFKDNVFAAVEKQFDEVDSYLSTQLDNLALSFSANPATRTSTPERNQTIFHPHFYPHFNPQPQPQPHIKLPPLHLPKFSGDIQGWPEFISLFDSSIHNSVSLQDSQKLQYLLSCLSGEPKTMVSSISIVNENYEVVRTLLKARYENQRVLISTLLKRLTSLDKVHADNLVELKKFRSNYSAVLESLKTMRVSIENWDPLLIHLLVQLFDKTLRREWEDKLSGKTEFPKLQFLDSFLDDRIHICEVMAVDTPKTQKVEAAKTPRSPGDFHKKTVHHGSTNDVKPLKCLLCSQNHSLSKCSKFLSFSPKQRYDQARSLNLCLNCLSSSHRVAECFSEFTCRTCHKKHHSLLHFTQGQRAPSDQAGAKAEKSADSVVKSSPLIDGKEVRVTSHHGISSNGHVLLATACLVLVGPQGQRLVSRALIDQCSEASFISESLVHTAKLRRHWSPVVVSGVGDPEGTRVKGRVTLDVHSQVEPGCRLNLEALILPRITSYVPPTLSLDSYTELSTLELADPQLGEAHRIDMLIGADYYAQLIREGLIRIGDKLVAQNTIFGWIISGTVGSSASRRTITVHHTVTDELSAQLRAFWELEEIVRVPVLTAEEQRCEDYFAATTTRDASGRFIVRLPFKIGCNRRQLGRSEYIARASLCSQRRKLDSNDSFRALNSDFLSEYETLGHMSLISGDPGAETGRVFLPHHGVLREDKVTTKLRVVFNASATTSSGKSLNDVLAIGPKLQTDITGVLLKWRMHRFVFNADIEKMFRQILVHPQDRCLQNILWYDSQLETIHRYQLNTVTYGTGPAPYLSMRVIRELANQARDVAPLASAVLVDNIYVDDVMFGADSRDLLLETKRQVVETLQSGCLTLRKWASNDPDLLEAPDQVDQAGPPIDEGGALVKLLGVGWAPTDDTLVISPTLLSSEANTKRKILSEIFGLFDPLGFLSPIVIRAKSFMQSLWLKSLGWDDRLPSDLQRHWSDIAADISALKEFRLNRWVHHSPHIKRAELVGFCDASILAYSAVVYLRIVDEEDSCFIHFIMAKSKVAPVKTTSIPRLELCGAVLLKDLVLHVNSLIGVKIDSIGCYSDSQIVLAWLDRTPSTWTTFVSNRVSAIQTELPEAVWRHVRSKENPADLNSRGISSVDFDSNELWWQGPAWLSHPDRAENSETLEADTEEERRKITAHLAGRLKNSVLEVVDHYSSWDKIVRIVAYVVRFVSLCRRRNTRGDLNTFSAYEIDESKRIILTLSQQVVFSSERDSLLKGVPVNPKSKLNQLDPYIDEYGLIRVGGRLNSAYMQNAAKHPVVLSNDALSTKVIRYTHLVARHGGLTLTLSLLRENYWVVHARGRVKYAIRTCVICKRVNPTLATQLMGDLPSERCTPSRPFTHAGVDYAGPLKYRSAKGRGHSTQKAWIVIFVCLSTKAVHLDLVTDYSSKAFLATLDRFVARRGLPATIFSDNGTTFQGADRELQLAFRSILQSEDVTMKFAVEGLVWKFIPPGAPHFGGLWEAGVKSVKGHLSRLMSDFSPTYEELYTILCGIEACLNSRPLVPLHDDIESLDALTPGHFLIGSTILAAPKRLDLNETVCLTDRWKQVALLVGSFWKRWRNEYLHTLQARSKWTRPEADVAVGDLVTIRTPNVPPITWPLARVIETFPGNDGRVRVVKVKTSRSEFVRPITQICVIPLPIDG